MADTTDTPQKVFVQSITLTRRTTGKSKGQALKEAWTASQEVGPLDFEVTSVDAWEVKFDKNGNEVRFYDD